VYLPNSTEIRNCRIQPTVAVKSLFLGVGERYPDEVVIRSFKVE
jgi:hypothetical protein